MMSGVLSLTTDADCMPPPKAVSSQVRLSRRQKSVLPEEEYINQLGNIIERDYFPDTEKMKNYLQVDAKNAMSEPRGDLRDMTVSEFFNNFTSEDNASFAELQAKDFEERKRKYHWLFEDKLLPAIENGGGQPKIGMMELYYVGGKQLTVQERQKMDRILDGEDARGDDRKNGADSWNFHVRNSLMFPPELEPRYENTASTSSSCRPSNDTLNIGGAVEGNYALLNNCDSCGSVGSENAMVVSNKKNDLVVHNPHVANLPQRGQKVIQAKNTNIRNQSSIIPTSIPGEEDNRKEEYSSYQNRMNKANIFSAHPHHRPTREQPHNPSIYSDDFSESETFSECGNSHEELHDSLYYRQKEYSLVPMTPLLEPGQTTSSNGIRDGSTGGNNKSTEQLEIFTFGEIFGAIRCLDPPSPVASTGMRANRLNSQEDRTRNAPTGDEMRSIIGNNTAIDAKSIEFGIGFEMLPMTRRDKVAQQLTSSSTPSRRVQETIYASRSSTGGNSSNISSSNSPFITAGYKKRLSTPSMATSSIPRSRSNDNATSSTPRRHSLTSLSPSAQSLAQKLYGNKSKLGGIF